VSAGERGARSGTPGATGRARICFHSGYLYPLFSHGRIPFAGGAETQQAQLARGLRDRGFEITIVTCDYGQPHEQDIDGLRFLATFPPRGGTPGLRFFHPRLTSTVSALRRADADLFYARGGGLTAGITSDVARALGRPFVLGTAHDHDARRSLPLLTRPHERWWQRRALRHADRIVAQTADQQRLYRAEFGRGSVVIPNLVAIPEVAVDVAAVGTIVWLGTYKEQKRPLWFLELARRLTRHAFRMSGTMPVPPDSPRPWDEAQAAARALPNLEVWGHVDPGQLDDLFRDAALFVHTSPVEGFPNTVLEAWARGVPTITAVNPDGLVTERGLGEVATSVDALVDTVARWMDDPARRSDAGARARAYVHERHAPGPVLDQWEALIVDTLGGGRS
jgi:glycosyltransferase involved in cell wall biosynthesis